MIFQSVEDGGKLQIEEEKNNNKKKPAESPKLIQFNKVQNLGTKIYPEQNIESDNSGDESDY